MELTCPGAAAGCCCCAAVATDVSLFCFCGCACCCAGDAATAPSSPSRLPSTERRMAGRLLPREGVLGPERLTRWTRLGRGDGCARAAATSCVDLSRFVTEQERAQDAWDFKTDLFWKVVLVEDVNADSRPGATAKTILDGCKKERVRQDGETSSRRLGSPFDS